MKLKVIFRGGFTDKYTNVNYKENQEINVEEARGKELLADPRKLVERVDKEKPKKKVAKASKS